MKTINLIVICLTIIILIGGIAYMSYREDISETPYKQCLDFCRGGYSNVRQQCMQRCHDDFKEVLFELSDKFFPLVERFAFEVNDERRY